MKKYLFITISAALALTACTNETTEYVGDTQAREIAFAPLAQKPTRAAITDGTFPTTEDIKVAAFDVTNSKNYFEGTTFSYNYKDGATGGTNNYWGGNPARYWPLYPAYINFLAYANVQGTGSFDNTTPASVATITMTDNSSEQKDLIYARGDAEVTQAASNGAFTFPEKVSLQFQHAQALISFKVQANSSAETGITVNSIKLNGAKYAGTFTITHTAYNANTGQSVDGAWSGLESVSVQNDITVPGISSGTAITTTATAIGNGLMVVPNGGITSFTVNYTMNGVTNNYTYTITPAPSLTKGTNYIYTIKFKLHEIFVDASVATWGGPTDSNITIQE